MTARIMWQRLDIPGHEICALEARDGGWTLEGTALLVHDARPCELRYLIKCGNDWQTESVHVSGNIGERAVAAQVTRTADGLWTMNGSPVPTVSGCIDIDMGFSPSTNTLPVRRLNLAVGQSADVRAAWLRFPELTLEVLEQTYTRLEHDRYLYESAGGAFRRELSTTADGFVRDYPDFWRSEPVKPRASTD